MKNIIIVILIILINTGCRITERDSTVYKDIVLKDSDRALISGLNNPLVDYILLKDDEEFLNKTSIPLISSGGTYSLNFEFISGGHYKFSHFVIKADSETKYILDMDTVGNSEGFSISTDGVFSTTPKVFLKRVSDIIFDTLDYETLSVEVVMDESSFLDPVPLTFKVSSNIPDATFHIYKYTIYWVKGPVLAQNEIYDMDTGEVFDPLEEGDDDPWGSGKYKIVTTNSMGETVFIVGFSDEWSKKHIHLTLD